MTRPTGERPAPRPRHTSHVSPNAELSSGEHVKGTFKCDEVHTA